MPLVSSDWPEWASNFYVYPFEFEDIIWDSAEHAYQAKKTCNLTDRSMIWAASSPGRAKQLGRLLDLRPGWDSMKDEVMLAIVRAKFAPGSELSKLLIAHRELLVEHTNWHDQYWGVCDCYKHQGSGLNKLGLILREVRSELRHKLYGFQLDA